MISNNESVIANIFVPEQNVGLLSPSLPLSRPIVINPSTLTTKISDLFSGVRKYDRGKKNFVAYNFFFLLI